MELIDDRPKMELIDDSIPSSSKKEEPSKTSIIDTVKKAVTTPLSHIKQATDVALPVAENLTSQVLGIGGFAASVPVAVRDYMQALFESGGDWDKAYEAGDRKSTRLNSSHQITSYAVFCLKKKNDVANTPHKAGTRGPEGRGLAAAALR